MNIKEIEKIVASIQTHIFRNSNSFSVGMLKSHFKGAGLQFKEHQVYNAGDDVRFIDWKLSAKTNTTYVKTFEEERNVEIYAILDITETMFMGYQGVSKLQAAIEIICLLCLLAEKSKDKVSPIIFADEVKILPLSSGQAGIIQLVSQLEKIGVLNSKGKVNLDYRRKGNLDEKRKLSMLKSFVARHKEVILLSDLSEITNYDVLNKLNYRPNMHCFKVLSPLDSANKIPFSILGIRNGRTKLMNAHSKREDINIGRYKKIEVDKRYLEEFVREML